MESWLRPLSDGSLLFLYVQPGASSSGIVGVHGGRLKVKIKAPPRDGEANEELVTFLSDWLQVGKRSLMLIQGESSRYKTVRVELSAETISTLISFSAPD